MNPSQKKLQEAFGIEEGRKIRRLLTGQDNPETYQAVSKWVAQCYNKPSDDELIMEAINEIIDGFGTEAIRGRYIDSYHQDIQAAFVNMGDTYTTTILLDHETGRYQITSWGDWVERNEKRRGMGATPHKYLF